MAYFLLEPFGELRADLRVGFATSMHVNANRDRKSPKVKLEHFMINFEKKRVEDTDEMSDDEMMSVAREISSSWVKPGGGTKNGK
jgi:hypothetical protein